MNSTASDFIQMVSNLASFEYLNGDNTIPVSRLMQNLSERKLLIFLQSKLND